jgi:hypothetical protein
MVEGERRRRIIVVRRRRAEPPRGEKPREEVSPEEAKLIAEGRHPDMLPRRARLGRRHKQ